jgi:hypothetical protein
MSFRPPADDVVGCLVEFGHPGDVQIGDDIVSNRRVRSFGSLVAALAHRSRAYGVQHRASTAEYNEKYIHVLFLSNGFCNGGGNLIARLFLVKSALLVRAISHRRPTSSTTPADSTLTRSGSRRGPTAEDRVGRSFTVCAVPPTAGQRSTNPRRPDHLSVFRSSSPHDVTKTP